MIGLRIFAAPAGSGDAAGGSSASLAKEMPAGASPFEVNVVDAKNRRWVLGSASAAESTGSNLARGAQPLRDAGDPGESAGDLAGNSAGSDRPNIATTLPPLPIKAPHSAQPSRAASEIMAPSIEGPGNEDSASRLPVIAGEEAGPARPPDPLPPPRAAAVPGGAAVPSANLPSANRSAAAGSGAWWCGARWSRGDRVISEWVSVSNECSGAVARSPVLRPACRLVSKGRC